MNPKKQIANTLTTWHNTPAFSRHSVKHLPALTLVVAVLCVLSYLTGRYLVSRQNLFVDSPPLNSPIVGGDSTPPVTQAPSVEPKPEPTPAEIESAKLVKLIKEFTATQPANFYIYVKDLKTGAEAKLNANTSVPSGSIYKLFLANQVYRLNEANKLNMFTAVGGTGYNYQSCTMQMVQNSLNACGEAVRAQLGAAAQTKSLVKQGYKNTNLMRNDAAHTSPQDIALLYQRLYKGGYFSKAHTSEFLGYLRDQLWTFRIPSGIPVEPITSGKADVLNKTGDVYDYANDAAIIYGEKTDLIIVIMSNNWPVIFPNSSYAIRELSGLIYNLANGTKYPLPYTSF